jgi:pimeloyl-ACP methyl ester carboxylesterase
MRYGRLHYREAGCGFAIVPLHINRQSSEPYVELMEVLSGAFHVLALDYPGYADRAAASAVVTSVRAGAAENDDASGDVEFVAAHGKQVPLAASPSWVARVRKAHRQCGNRCWQAPDALLAYDLRAALARVDVPSLLATGELSPFAGFMPELRRLMPGARSQVIPSAGSTSAGKRRGRSLTSRVDSSCRRPRRLHMRDRSKMWRKWNEIDNA